VAVRRLTLLLTALVLVLVPNAAHAGSSRSEQRYATQAVHATNKQRTHEGLEELDVSACLRRYAVHQATAMAQQESLFHQELGPVLGGCELDLVGENVASGFPSGRSVVDDGWMNSEGHRANILDPHYRLIAIGARKGHDGRWYVSQVFGRRS